ncbi:M20 family metallopeptidase [Cohnella sp. WQ 127256]|uniref:M20 family metallopeptidase n=1 Tax=Cohnella sp. WQ 127256 TaxID=2938790 RepID=UPI002117DEE9|nr:M20 family metallopeptidase [Cohnella sp. WQ 127256]
MLTREENELLQSIDEAELIGFLQALVRTNSENPPGREMAVANLIAHTLQSFGCQVEIQPVDGDRFNVIVILEGEQSEKILFNGHTDTVPVGNLKLWSSDPWAAEIRDGRLYGLGSCDMKAGLAAMIYAIKALVESKTKFIRGLIFTAVIDEEVNFLGTTALLSDNKLADCVMAYVSEPTSLRIGNRLKGAIEFSARTYGKSAHTGVAFNGENAIYKMSRYIEALRSYNDSLAKDYSDPDLRYPTVNVGKIQGGVGVTLVPDYCELEFDRQVLPSESMDEAEIEIRKLTASINESEQIGVELVVRQSFSTWTIPEEEEVVRRLSSSIQDATSQKPELMGFNGYAEVELLSAAGIPSVLYGPGSINVAHAPDEFVPMDEVIQAARVYALMAYRFVTQS